MKWEVGQEVIYFPVYGGFGRCKITTVTPKGFAKIEKIPDTLFKESGWARVGNTWHKSMIESFTQERWDSLVKERQEKIDRGRVIKLITSKNFTNLSTDKLLRIEKIVLEGEDEKTDSH